MDRSATNLYRIGDEHGFVVQPDWQLGIKISAELALDFHHRKLPNCAGD
jgi:hypothetical protein